MLSSIDMTSKFFTITLGTLGFSFAALAGPQPNIVHIFVDDLGWQDVAAYYKAQHKDEPLHETPHIDRVVSKGMSFMKAYSPSPTCSPSRAAYLSGQFGVKNGVFHVKGSRIPRPWGDRPEMNPFYSARLPITKTVIPTVLKKEGYVTAHVGKWHVCGENQVPTPLQLGFDFSYGKDHKYNDTDLIDPKDKKINNKEGIFAQPKPTRLDAFNDPKFLPLVDDERPYDSLTDISLRWLGKVGKQDQPFFLNFCPKLVHGPIMTRDRKRLAYYCKKLGIPFPKDPGAIADPEAPGHNNPYYASMVDSVDWMVGKVVNFLETTDDPRNPGHKLIDNTYLIISSDNGGAQRLATWKGLDGKKNFEKVTDNAPLREGKSYVYEGGVRIPFIVMGPGVKPGVVNENTAISLLDLFPTFVAIAGTEADPALALDGCDILPILQGDAKLAKHSNGEVRDTLYFHHPADNKSYSVIRRGPWKLMKNTGPGVTEAPLLQLFKIDGDDGGNNDLAESKNLVDKYPEVAEQLLADLESWMAKHDAEVPHLNPLTTAKLPGKSKVPVVTTLGSKASQVWVNFETKGKAKVVDAYLLYSLNGDEELKFRKGRLEEWFRKPAKIEGNRVSAQAAPGMTHGVFCLIDENNFLVYSEPVPAVGGKWRIDASVSMALKDGYAYRPGLIALIELAKKTQGSLAKKGAKVKPLVAAIKKAESTVKQPVTEKVYAPVIRDLRHALRAFDGKAAEVAHPDLHRLHLGQW